jgi:hypothetical protein
MVMPFELTGRPRHTKLAFHPVPSRKSKESRNFVITYPYKVPAHFTVSGRSYLLRCTLDYCITSSGGFFTAENSELCSFLGAESREELLDLIIYELDLLWRNYAEANDDELSSDACDLKRAVLHYICEA